VEPKQIFCTALLVTGELVLVCRAASLDVEPVYTFRAHEGPVLSLAMSPTGESCYSGGMDGTICCWNIPNSNIDPYDSFGESSLLALMLCSYEVRM